MEIIQVKCQTQGRGLTPPYVAVAANFTPPPTYHHSANLILSDRRDVATCYDVEAIYIINKML